MAILPSNQTMRFNTKFGFEDFRHDSKTSLKTNCELICSYLLTTKNDGDVLDVCIILSETLNYLITIYYLCGSQITFYLNLCSSFYIVYWLYQTVCGFPTIMGLWHLVLQNSCFVFWCHFLKCCPQLFFLKHFLHDKIQLQVI